MVRPKNLAQKGSLLQAIRKFAIDLSNFAEKSREIDINWGKLIPELSKTRKVIAIELQDHGHTQFSDRKLSRATLASDVEGVMDHLKIDSAD